MAEQAGLVVVTGASSGISISAEELADIILFCWRQPPHICIRDIVVMPTSSGY